MEERFIMKNLLLSVWFVVFSFQSFSFSESENSFSNHEGAKTILQGSYIGGGFVGTFVGFGIGHAIQGRYLKKGWIFTAGSILIPVGYVGAVFFALGAGYSGEKAVYGAAYTSLGVMILGLGLKIWEIIDVWMLPSHYKVVKEKPFQIKPLAFYDSDNKFHYGLSLNYQF